MALFSKNEKSRHPDGGGGVPHWGDWDNDQNPSATGGELSLLSVSLNIYLNTAKMLWNLVLGSNYGYGFCILPYSAIKG